MELHATSPAADPQRVPEGIKFLYASGSRPLDGYTIKRGIGRGGFGEVYYATSDAGKEVALKLIRRNLDIELRGVTQCLNLKHTNLLSLFDIKSDPQGDRWVVMEYVSGESLEQLLDRYPRGVPAAEALAWIHGLCAGVAYLHEHGIVHRDLKPGNIFSDDGMVKIGDYGLSKFISCSRRSGQTDSVGTVHYMAPEIANGRYGKEIDLYAIGIIIYEILTGHVPFEGESVGEVLMKHLTAEPNLAGLPTEYRSIVGRLLTKDPANRIASVNELIALLPGGAGVHLITPRLPARMPGGDETHAARPRNASEQRTPFRNEPLLAAILLRRDALVAWWNDPRTHTIERIVAGIGIASLVILSGVCWSISLPLLGGYLIYAIVRLLILPDMPVNPPPSAPPALPAALAETSAGGTMPTPSRAELAPERKVTRFRRPRYEPLKLPVLTPRERATQLLGSLLLSAAATVAVSLLGLVLLGATLEKSVTGNQFVWIVLVSLVGAWIVQILSAAWPQREGDPVVRRLMLVGAGLIVGVVACSLQAEMNVSLPAHPDFTPGRREFDATRSYPLTPFLAHFAFMFVLQRWWRQTDPLRPHRVSILAVGAAVLWIWILSVPFNFPQPWSMVVAGTTSLAVQLGSPWMGGRPRVVHDE